MVYSNEFFCNKGVNNVITHKLSPKSIMIPIFSTKRVIVLEHYNIREKIFQLVVSKKNLDYITSSVIDLIG